MLGRAGGCVLGGDISYSDNTKTNEYYQALQGHSTLWLSRISALFSFICQKVLMTF